MEFLDNKIYVLHRAIIPVFTSPYERKFIIGNELKLVNLENLLMINLYRICLWKFNFTD